MDDRPIEVAVVIVTYKTAALAIDCLRSVARERETSDLRINAVVVDNDSGDAPSIEGAAATMQWTSWVTIVRAQRNGGFGYGNNVGFKRANQIGHPDFFLMLNPDTLLRAGAVDELVKFLQSHPQAGIAGSAFENQDGSEWPIAFRFPTLLSEVETGLQTGIASRLLSRYKVARAMSSEPERTDWVSGASMMITRRTLELIGGLDEGYFLYFEETDYSFRARAHDLETWRVPQSRVMHIAGQSTKVTERNAAKKRLPKYWFESRRRFFWVNYGQRYAGCVDAAALVAHWLGGLKRLLLGRRQDAVPNFLADLFSHRTFANREARAAIADRIVPRL